MRRWLGIGGVMAGVALLAACPARALQFELISRDDGSYAIVAQGPVVSGDTARLAAALTSQPKGTRLSLVALDSPGGDVDEGLALAEFIHESRLSVVVPPGAKCTSICFIMFAASPGRFAAVDALIGVHSASQLDGETVLAKARTTELARLAGEYGVPPEIVGIMVQARPRQMEWLTPQMLASMEVRVWSGTPGEQKQTARPDPVPSVRTGAPGEPSGAASVPVYAAPEPIMTRSAPAPATGAILGPTFRGALFCRQGVRRLALEFGATLDRGTLSFSPGAASHDGVSGSLLVEGRLDPSAVTVRPTSWVSRVGDVAMVGLHGHSEDGGKTFHGNVTAGLECSSFTMQRTR